MNLLNTIKSDLFRLRKRADDKLAISLLTTLYSEAANIGLNDGKRESTDAEVIAMIKKFISNLDQCVTAANKLRINTDNQKQEIKILEAYLPKQLTETELRSIIKPLVDAGENKGVIMRALKENYGGQYDGKLAASIVDTI